MKNLSSIPVTEHRIFSDGGDGARVLLPALRAAVPLPPPGDAPRHLPQRRALALSVPDLRVPCEYIILQAQCKNWGIILTDMS